MAESAVLVNSKTIPHFQDIFILAMDLNVGIILSNQRIILGVCHKILVQNITTDRH